MDILGEISNKQWSLDTFAIPLRQLEAIKAVAQHGSIARQ